MLTVAIVTVMLEMKNQSVVFSYWAKWNSRSKNTPVMIWCEIPNK
jgi:hypothetical protein